MTLKILRIALLGTLAILLYTVLFPDQLKNLSNEYSDYKTVQDIEFNRLKSIENRKPITLKSICSEELRAHQNANVVPITMCTLKLCPRNSCCNACSLQGWQIENTRYNLPTNIKGLSGCRVNGCGALENCPQYLTVRELQKSCLLL